MLDGLIPRFRFPESSLVYFQFVFAAITPILMLGAVIGRISFRVWLLFVPLWITLAYTVNAFLLWGGGWWAAHGALDFSGGYVIHLAAGVSGFVAAAAVAPRLRRDRDAGADAAAAVINTNLATAVAMMTWIILDMLGGGDRKPSFIGGVNGMICGLVAITPAAGYVNGLGALVIGLVAAGLVWVAMTYLPRYAWPFNKVDDALGVVYTHGFAGLLGGLLVGLFADPKMIVYLGIGKNPDVSTTGLFYGHPKQLLIQAGAAGTVIVWDAVITYLILKGLSLFMSLRASDADLELGDLAVH